MTLSPTTAVRIRRLVPLLGSPIDGEALAARNAIVRELASDQHDLHDLAAAIGCGSDPAPVMPHRAGAPAAFGDLARAVRDADGGRLQPHERAFVQKMLTFGFSRSPSPRQRAWIEDLHAKLSARAAA